MEAKHTSGPWTLHAEHESLWGNSGQSREFEMQADTGVVMKGRAAFRHDNHAAPYANARLIAAAPDLLEVLEELIGALPSREYMAVEGKTEGPLLVRARAAIAKARGQ